MYVKKLGRPKALPKPPAPLRPPPPPYQELPVAQPAPVGKVKQMVKEFEKKAQPKKKQAAAQERTERRKLAEQKKQLTKQRQKKGIAEIERLFPETKGKKLTQSQIDEKLSKIKASQEQKRFQRGSTSTYEESKRQRAIRKKEREGKK